MAEILQSVADATAACGVETLVHTGEMGDVDDGRTVFVVVPHEYFVLAAEAPRDILNRTISFGVEHPGTQTFEAAASASAATAARFEISADSVAVLHQRGQSAERFVLGYNPRWDKWHGIASRRAIDVAYLGTADPDRLATLATIAPDLADLRAELLIPPHEPMTRPRPDFLMGEAKWSLLANTRLLLNLHREGKSALEWVRVLEAICNGCVVLSEPSTDMGSLIAGEHILISSPARLGAVAKAALYEPETLSAMARSAYDMCKQQLDMGRSAERLIDIASQLSAAATRRDVVRQPAHPSAASEEQPMALWIPTDRDLRPPSRQHKLPILPTQREVVGARQESNRTTYLKRSPDGAGCEVDLVCVGRLADGPIGLTLNSISLLARDVAIACHLATIGAPLPRSPALLDHLSTYVSCNQATSRGMARNDLLACGSAPYVLILDAGDELLAPVVSHLVSSLRSDSSARVAYCMAVLGSRMIVNALVPEARRLRAFAYLTRGYLVRRSWLEHLGGYINDPEHDGFEDHEFWSSTAATDGKTILHRCVGIRLWDREPAHESVGT